MPESTSYSTKAFRESLSVIASALRAAGLFGIALDQSSAVAFQEALVELERRRIAAERDDRGTMH